jgi:transketolase
MTRQELTKHIITCAYKNQAGHIAPALSILDIIITLYNNVLKEDDEFILSKGHGCLALYAVLWDKGYITEEQFYSFTQFDSILGGHPSSRKIPQVKLSTGSLGHGLPFAVGLAMAKKIKGEAGTVYCLIGDGEANEGSIWEAALIAGHHKLNNLVVIVDSNGSGDRAINLCNSNSKSRLGFTICERFIVLGSFWGDGFEYTRSKFLEVLHQFTDKKEGPIVLDCKTIKGYGCKSMEGNPAWHHRQPKTEEELNQLLSEIH